MRREPEQRALVSRLDAMRVKLDVLPRLEREAEAELASFTPAPLAKASGENYETIRRLKT